MGRGPLEYPIHLGLAYLFLVGYLVRSVFVNVRLPGAVGVILTGFTFSYFIQDDIFFGRDHLQGLAFFLVLLTAGFEISLMDLKPYIMAFAFIPAAMEMLGVAAYAYFVLHFSKTEACVLGTVLFAIGDGLVIPKMGEFGDQFPGHPMPRLVFTWAPLEASFALTLFGVLEGLSEPVHQQSTNVTLLIVGNILRIVATIAVGGLVGAASGWVIPRRKHAVFRNKALFTNATVEAFLMILAIALAGYGFGAAEGGVTLVPMGFSPGSLFQPELLVIVIGCSFAAVANPEELHNVEAVMGGVWVFGQLILFSMLGSKTDPGVFMQFFAVLPMIAVGLFLRLIGVFVVTWGTLRCRQCNCEQCYKANSASAFYDAIFCFLSTLPRASIQGALGAVPITENFFQFDPKRAQIQTFIATAAKLYIVLMSIVGSVLLDFLGRMMLEYSQESDLRNPRCEAATSKEEEYAEIGWTAQERRRSTKYVQLPPLEEEEGSQDFAALPPLVCLSCCKRKSRRPSKSPLGMMKFMGAKEVALDEDYDGLPAQPNVRHALTTVANFYGLSEAEAAQSLKAAAAATDEDSGRLSPVTRKETRKSTTARRATVTFRSQRRLSTLGARHTFVNQFETAMRIFPEDEDGD